MSFSRLREATMYAEIMRIEVIFCPSCQHKLRIPEDLLGQPVQCPQCRAMFIAPPPPPPAPGAAPEPRSHPSEPREPYDAIADDARSERQVDDRTTTWLTMCGTGLIVASLLSVLACLLRIVIAFSPQMMQAMANSPFGAMPANIDPKPIFLAWGIGFGLISALGVLGGAAMLRRGSYTLAMVGSLAAIVNLSDCCCIILNGPIGVAGLILLLQPHIKAKFR